MKKMIAFLVLVLLIAAGCGDKETTSAGGDSSTSGNEAKAEDTTESESPVTDLSKAYAGGSFECTMQLEGAEVKMYVKDGKHFSEATVNGKKWDSIYNGEYMYSWDVESKQGIKVNVKEMQDSAPEQGDAAAYTPSKMQESATKVLCKKASISDSKFVPPSDVEFQDIAEMMAQAKAQMERMQAQQ